MSGTHESERWVSKQTFYTKACRIESLIHDKLPNENIVSKRRSFYLGLPTAQIASQMVDYLEDVDGFFPNTLKNWEKRRECYILARSCCWKLKRRLHMIIDKNENARASSFKEISDLLDEEIAMLTDRYKNCRPILKKGQTLGGLLEEAEDKMAHYGAEAERIRDAIRAGEGL